jgi:hypothetical protein
MENVSSSTTAYKNNDKLKEFDGFFLNELKPVLLAKYSDDNNALIKQLMSRFESVIDYNVPHGKKMRGLCTFESVDYLLAANSSKSSSDDDKLLLLKQSKALGWCIEFVIYLIKNFQVSNIFLIKVYFCSCKVLF